MQSDVKISHLFFSFVLDEKFCVPSAIARWVLKSCMFFDMRVLNSTLLFLNIKWFKTPHFIIIQETNTTIQSEAAQTKADWRRQKEAQFRLLLV